jgi:hypothetical protein
MPGLRGFTLGSHGSVWKGQKGWWASRKGTDGHQGPFGGHRLAQAWVEEPLVQAAQEKEARRTERAEQASQKKASAREAQDAKTWGALPPEERTLRPGQIWAHKANPGREAMVLEVRRDTLVGLFRSDPARPWKDAERDTKDVRAFLKQYGYRGVSRG